MSEEISCKRCLYTSSHPLGLTIDEFGICSGCRIHEEKDHLDWNERGTKLAKIAAEYRSPSKNIYDCIVPITGAQDSYYILHIVKEKLGLNPLLVTYNRYWNTPLGIRNLANLRIKSNCDILIQNVNPLSVKKIVRTTLRNLGSINWHCIAGQTVFPVQTAVRYKIPLIIWGAHQGLEQVGMFSHLHEVEMSRRYRKDHDLMGLEPDDLLSHFDTLKEQDIWQYRYPDDHDLNSVGVRGIYLGNYVRWDPKVQHEQMIKVHNYQTAQFSRTFDCYDFVDCYNYMGLHDLLKFYKHGYSKVTDHATREIRHGRLNRENGAALVKHFQSQPANYLGQFANWLGVEPDSLNFLLDFHRNGRYWRRNINRNWDFLGKVTIDQEEATTNLDTGRCLFEANSALSLDQTDRYITIGKGWP